MTLLLNSLFALTIFIVISANVRNAHCQQSPANNQSASSSAMTTEKPSSHHNSLSHSSTSSSASSEDQLAPSAVQQSDGSISQQSSVSSTCVTCPQTVCTLSKVSYVRNAIHHNWRVDGLPDYIAYLEKFQAPFQMASEVRFNATPPNDGNWVFTLIRAAASSSVELRVTYRYRTQTRYPPPKISFDLWLSVHVEDEYVTLPSQISSLPTLTNEQQVHQQQPRHSNNYVWTFLFLWSDLQTKLVTLIESHGLESQLVEFKFVINSYQEGNLSSADADCQNWSNTIDERNGGSGEQQQQQHHESSPPHNHQKGHRNNIHGSYQANPVNNATWPPFLHQMYTIMKDDKYTDLTVKTGEDEFQIHRIIAAYSSPVLALMIYNMTYQKSESLLDLGEDIGSDVVEELIRYMYTGRVEDVEEIADRLLMAATNYGFPALKRQCETVLIKQVKTENAFSMYALGVEVGSMRLKRKAFNVMKENKSKIVAQSEEFRKLSVHHPDVMYELFLS